MYDGECCICSGLMHVLGSILVMKRHFEVDVVRSASAGGYEWCLMDMRPELL